MRLVPLLIPSLFVSALSWLPAQGPTGGADAPAAPPTPRAAIREVADQAYVTGERAHASKHKLDLYLPAPAAPAVDAVKAPLVMFVHGGAWRSGDRSVYRPLGRLFAERGIACAVISYRLSPENVHPAHVEDVAAAFRWVVDHAEQHGCDKERLFVCGHSAGGHLVALLAVDPRWLAAHDLKPSAIRGVVPVSAPFEVTADLSLFDAAFGTDAAVRRAASPLRHVSKGAPPFLVLWADQDMTGLPLSGRAFTAAVQRAGGTAASHEIADRTHASIMSRFGRTGDRTSALVYEFVEASAGERAGR